MSDPSARKPLGTAGTLLGFGALGLVLATLAGVLGRFWWVAVVVIGLV